MGEKTIFSMSFYYIHANTKYVPLIKLILLKDNKRKRERVKYRNHPKVWINIKTFQKYLVYPLSVNNFEKKINKKYINGVKCNLYLGAKLEIF